MQTKTSETTVERTPARAARTADERTLLTPVGEWTRPLAGQTLASCALTEQLLELERKRDLAIRLAALEWGITMELPLSGTFWRTAIPQALLRTLESFEREASRRAAETFLASLEAP